jgi:hypothetical protein
LLLKKGKTGFGVCVFSSMGAVGLERSTAFTEPRRESKGHVFGGNCFIDDSNDVPHTKTSDE